MAMTDDSKKPSDDRLPEDVDSSTASRRDFLKVAGAGAGALIVGGSGLSEPRKVPGIVPLGAPAVHTTATSEIVVIGAGGWGSVAALTLRRRGHSVPLVDSYAPENARGDAPPSAGTD